MKDEPLSSFTPLLLVDLLFVDPVVFHSLSHQSPQRAFFARL